MTDEIAKKRQERDERERRKKSAAQAKLRGRKCQLCDKALKIHEAPEGYCDDCLRANKWTP